MKKIFTLILALIAFVVGSQTARAEATEDLEVVLKNGMALNDPDYNNEYMGIMSLLFMGQLSTAYSENGQSFQSTATGRTLFYLDGNNVVTIAQDVTKADEFTYTVTDANRMKLSGTFKQFMEPYQTISLYFALFPYNPFEVTIESGMDYFEKEEVGWAINALVFLNQLQKNDDGAFYSVETGKVLFTVKNGGIVTVSEDVTPYDNICYIITDEDREALSNPFFLEDCDAIVVNFVPGSGSGGNTDLLTYEGTLKSGMNLYAQENNQLNLAINALVATDYLTEFFYSGHSGPHHDEEMSLIMSLMYFLTETNKHLFSVSPEGIVTLSDELSAADDISYVITEADRTIFEEKGYAEDLAPYGTIKIHFGAGGDGIQPTGIELNKSTLRYTSVGQAHHLIATVYPSDATQSVTWKSDNTQVATVDDKGLITVTGFGETTIHASTANNLVADCQVSVKQFIGGDLGTQGTWRFEDGVLTVDYNGQMPWNCTSKTTDPEVAYRLKWIDLLSQIKEIVITGKDVEIQPYFLFYSGDGDLGQHPDDHVRTLTLGSGVKKVGKQALTLYDLKRVNVYSIDPPVLASDLGESNCFWKRRIQDNLAFLYLPANAGIGYAMMSSEWAFFNHSTNHLDMADNPVGIDEMKSEELRMKNEGAWYTLDGRQVVNGKLPRGIYINNGKKVVVK